MFERLLNSLSARASTIRSLFGFLIRGGLWWLIPFVLILLLFFALIILGGSTPLGPFIYTIF